MPLLNGSSYIARSPPSGLTPDSMVFCIPYTGEVFKDYDEYFSHLIELSSMKWKCTVNGTENLTYKEALESEAAANVRFQRKNPTPSRDRKRPTTSPYARNRHRIYGGVLYERRTPLIVCRRGCLGGFESAEEHDEHYSNTCPRRPGKPKLTKIPPSGSIAPNELEGIPSIDEDSGVDLVVDDDPSVNYTETHVREITEEHDYAITPAGADTVSPEDEQLRRSCVQPLEVIDRAEENVQFELNKVAVERKRLADEDVELAEELDRMCERHIKEEAELSAKRARINELQASNVSKEAEFGKKLEKLAKQKVVLRDFIESI